MKKVILVSFSMLVLIACKETSTETTKTKTIVSEAIAVIDSNAVNDLAAFYTGTMPCPNCEGIETLLTLNADEKRTYTLEEQYKGKETKKVDSDGTWSVADDIVSLSTKTQVSKYQITTEGLVSLNVDGSKRDTVSAKKHLLKKVLGE